MEKNAESVQNGTHKTTASKGIKAKFDAALGPKKYTLRKNSLCIFTAASLLFFSSCDNSGKKTDSNNLNSSKTVVIDSTDKTIGFTPAGSKPSWGKDMTNPMTVVIEKLISYKAPPTLVNANLKGLPATTIIGAQYDPLRSEGALLAENLKKAGVSVNYKLYNGTTHEFFGMAAVVAEAKDAQALVTDDLKNAINK